MTQEWLERKIKENEKEIAEYKKKIIKMLDDSDYLDAKAKNIFLKKLALLEEKPCCATHSDGVFANLIYNKFDESTKERLDYCDFINLVESLNLHEYIALLENPKDYEERYLDSEPMEFDGDIIITDPCYVVRAEHHGTKPITEDDWEACNYGSEMEVFGIHNYMTRDTIYGDWSCTVYNTDTEKKIGSFCADAGLVSVFLLDEVLKYNPDFDWDYTKPWTTTLIENFKGTVQFIVLEQERMHKNDFIHGGNVYWRKGDRYTEYEVQVVGHGINKTTGVPINFVGKQTGF